MIGFGYKYRDGREKNRSFVIRWVLTLLSGFVTGLIGITLFLCTKVVSEWKRDIMEQSMIAKDSSPAYVFSILLAFNATLVLMAAFLTIFVAPVAAGSGTICRRLRRVFLSLSFSRHV